VLAEEKLDEISGGLNIPIKNPHTPCTGDVSLKFQISRLALTPEKIFKYDCEHFIAVLGMCVQEG
jgi:hypothetical protein